MTPGAFTCKALIDRSHSCDEWTYRHELVRIRLVESDLGGPEGYSLSLCIMNEQSTGVCSTGIYVAGL